jgi:phosphoglycerate dehydrogenase-like enzyme
MQDRNLYMGNDINNKTIGIVGLGNVGRRIAKLCATVFDMKVLAYDPFLDEKTIAERNATKVELDELCRRADFISINCPLDDTTRNMIGKRQFGLMQKHAYFITAARGFITDEKAPVPGSTFSQRSRRRRTILSCNSTTSSQARTRLASPKRPAPTWESLLPSN